MSDYEVLSLLFDFYICVILTVEYWFGHMRKKGKERHR